MRRALIVTLALVAALGMPAAVAGDETRTLSTNGVLTCLRSTGAEGALTLVKAGARGYAAERVAATSSSVRLAGPVGLPRPSVCPATAEAGGGAVAAALVTNGGHARLIATVRDPGHRSPPASELSRATIAAVAVAMSPRGDAAVAWFEETRPVADSATRTRLMVAVRRPGGALGRPRPIFDWTPTDGFFEANVALAFDSASELTLAWARPRGPNAAGITSTDVEAATLGPGASAPRTQRLAPYRQGDAHVALSVAASGAALLAFDSGGVVSLAERTSDRRAFGRAERVPHPPARPGDLTALAADLDATGAASVAWREGEQSGDADDERVYARTRPAGGAFGPTRLVHERTVRADDAGGWVAFLSIGVPPTDAGTHRLEVTVRPDGRALLAWVGRRDGGTLETQVATVGSDGAVNVRAPGTPCRPAYGAVILEIAGRTSLAFTDHRAISTDDIPLAGGALHVLDAEAALTPRPPSPAPRATIGPVAKRPVRYGQSLRVPVTCDRECDLLVQSSSTRRGFTTTRHTSVTARAGVPQHVTLDPDDGTLVSRRDHGVPVRVTACAPDGSSSTVVTSVLPATQVPARAGPTPREVVARRVGRTIEVTWSIARPQPRISFTVYALDPGAGFDPRAAAKVHAGGRTRFRTVLDPRHPGRVTKVVVQGFTDEAPHLGGSQTVKLR